jgi:hypothetical protein
VLLTAAAAALTIGLGATAAVAAGTWSVSPGGTVAAHASTTVLKDTKTGTTVTCTSSSLDGTLKSGSGLSGSQIGSITGGAVSNCGGPEGLVIIVKLLDLPWHFNLKSYSAGVSHGTISHIEISVSTTDCSFVVDGTAGGASDGIVDFTYTNSTHKLQTSGGDLHIYDVSGCFGLVGDGDPAEITADYTLSPAQTITGS